MKKIILILISIISLHSISLLAETGVEMMERLNKELKKQEEKRNIILEKEAETVKHEREFNELEQQFISESDVEKSKKILEEIKEKLPDIKEEVIQVSEHKPKDDKKDYLKVRERYFSEEYLPSLLLSAMVQAIQKNYLNKMKYLIKQGVPIGALPCIP